MMEISKQQQIIYSTLKKIITVINGQKQSSTKCDRNHVHEVVKSNLIGPLTAISKQW